jgi:1,4-dihydroxy-6-naphthoate synthase
MAAVAAGAADAGVIIHESRFTFRQHGLQEVLDLGQWWEQETGLPIPLGGILARRALGAELIGSLDAALRASVEYAFAHPEEPKDYIRKHSQELSESVIESHIGLYVNHFSRDLGSDGRLAIEALFSRAAARGIIPPCDFPLFAA